MEKRKFRLHDGRTGSALAIRVTPRARKNEISGIMSDGTVKVRLTAPPVEGRANAALIEYLAAVLEISKSRIEIIAGATGHDKLVSILDLDSHTVQKRLLEKMS